ncbi:hypothetical protein F4776DRAFT_951 [Hypoxylon sp. NC0597]|nr:hypothetical protein F4776DRAFT_951 [Hypoxylon sp. NC0597]
MYNRTKIFVDKLVEWCSWRSLVISVHPRILLSVDFFFFRGFRHVHSRGMYLRVFILDMWCCTYLIINTSAYLNDFIFVVMRRPSLFPWWRKTLLPVSEWPKFYNEVKFRPPTSSFRLHTCLHNVSLSVSLFHPSSIFCISLRNITASITVPLETFSSTNIHPFLHSLAQQLSLHGLPFCIMTTNSPNPVQQSSSILFSVLLDCVFHIPALPACDIA